MSSFSDVLEAGLALPEPEWLTPEQLETRSRRRRSRWIARERGRSWGRGFAVGIVSCVLLAGALRAGEAWGASPAPVPASSMVVVGGRSTLGSRPPVVKPPVRTMAQLEAIASKWSGRPVSIVCEPPALFDSEEPDADAYVDTTETRDSVTGELLAYTIGTVIHLRREFCGPLLSLGLRTVGYWREQFPNVIDIDTQTGRVIDEQDGAAVSILWHETRHESMQSLDEAAVECESYRTASTPVRSFHLPRWLATRIVRGMAWHHRGLPAPYQDAC